MVIRLSFVLTSRSESSPRRSVGRITRQLAQLGAQSFKSGGRPSDIEHVTRRGLLAVLVIVVFTALCGPASAAVPSTWDRGFNFTGWWYNDYSSASAATSLPNLATTGPTSIPLRPIWFA